MAQGVRSVVEVGQPFGSWTVLDPDVGREPKSGAVLVLARCSCGFEKVHAAAALKRSRCCVRCYSDSSANRETLGRMSLLRTTHGMHGHLLYATWQGMMDRCYDPAAAGYEYYGGRGIAVCKRWHDVAAFIADIEVSIGLRPEGMTLDRFPDPDGNYELGNVRWATWLQQGNNKSSRKVKVC